jgi:hypothetical protein
MATLSSILRTLTIMHGAADPSKTPDYSRYVIGGLSGAEALSRAPVTWVGYDSSPYAVAKTLVVATMMRRGAETDAILQVGHSLGKNNSLPPVNWRWVEEGDGYVGRLQPPGQPLGVGLPSGLQCLVPYPYRSLGCCDGQCMPASEHAHACWMAEKHRPCRYARPFRMTSLQRASGRPTHLRCGKAGISQCNKYAPCDCPRQAPLLLQVWYSAAWTRATLAAFREAVTALLAGQAGSAAAGEPLAAPAVLQLLRHWQLVDVPLRRARQEWLDSINDCNSCAAGFKLKEDRWGGGGRPARQLQHEYQLFALMYCAQPLLQWHPCSMELPA